MAHYIFSNEKYLTALVTIQKLSIEIQEQLFQRLGIHRKSQDIVTIIVISKDPFDGIDSIFTLAEECQKLYKKEIEINKLRIIALPTIESAMKSPHLERASFILIPEENLLSANIYPELEKILPFRNIQ
ncbi:MAG: hypothetical protein KBC41_02375 [Candidatus Pacebacteria bacterium]|nr:hypothetical protein [Candidatus Paceibacterota bacterium]MBP9866901.1 hypothetical protein [Candidatus Paceibacterota bacterium]